MARASKFAMTLCARAVFLFAVYMLLADNPAEPEMLTGAVIAVVAAGCAQLIAADRQDVHLRPTMLRRAYRPLLLLATDTVRVTSALLGSLIGHGPNGHVRAVRYRATSKDPQDYARRVLTQWGTSLGANRYVLGIDNENQILIVHELVEASGPLDPLELG
jgi:hypothetical protein